MSGARRGLVAPQNTFLENIIRRSNGQYNSFILANARIFEYPIVYCNDGFFKLTGFNRAEVMQQSCMCKFMWFSAIRKESMMVKVVHTNKIPNNNNTNKTDDKREADGESNGVILSDNNSASKDDTAADVAMTKLLVAMDRHEASKVEIQLYKKNKELINLIIEEFPIKNENRAVIFFLLTFIDITSLRQQPEPDSKFITFARLARSMAKQKPIPGHSNTISNNNKTSNNNNNTNSITDNTIVDSNESIPKSEGVVVLPDNKTNNLNGNSAEFEEINLNSDDPNGHKDFTQKADHLASIFSLHSEFLPQYKQETPRTPPDILLHYSTFKTCWDWLILLLTGYTAVMVPFNVAFNSRTLENITILIVDNVVDVFFFIDIILNFHTTFVGPSGEIISDSSVIQINYLKGWFLIDLLSCLPYDVLNAFEPETNEARGVSQLFGALKVVRLLRLGRVLRKMDQYMEYMATILALMMFGFLLLAHWLACAWYFIGIEDINNKIFYGWIPKMLIDNGQTINRSTSSNFTYNPTNVADIYVTALYFTLSLLTTIGFGNVSANTILEKWICVGFMLIGALVYAIIFGNVTTIFQQFYATRARFQEMMKNVKEFMSLHEIPSQLRERVIDYITSSWVITKGIDTHLVLNYCPKDMKADLCVHLNRHVFNEHPAFRLASDGCLRALAVEFFTLHSAPGDLIYHQGESIEQLSFVVSGSLEILQDGEVIAILGKGDVFGDNFWKEGTVGQSAATVRALTYCDLHCIKREKLLTVLKFYHAFCISFSKNLILTYNLRNRIIFRTIEDANREKQLQLEQRRLDEMGAVAPSSKALSKDSPRILNSSNNPIAAPSSMNKLIAKFKRLNSHNMNNNAGEAHLNLSTTSTSLTNTAEVIREDESNLGLAKSSLFKTSEAPRVHFLKVHSTAVATNTTNKPTSSSTDTSNASLEGNNDQGIILDDEDNHESCGYHIDYINKMVVEMKKEMKDRMLELDERANNIDKKVNLLYNHLIVLSN